MKKLIVIIALLTSCEGRNSQDEPLQCVKDFLTWYELNYQKANSFGLVNQGDSTVFYSVNFEETEKFLAYLKSSGFVSETWLRNFREQFKKAEQNFKDEPINEGPPPGFDYDIVLLTQEPDMVFGKKNDPLIISSEVRGENAVLKLDLGMKLQFSLTKEDGKWKIDRITYAEE